MNAYTIRLCIFNDEENEENLLLATIVVPPNVTEDDVAKEIIKKNKIVKSVDGVELLDVICEEKNWSWESLEFVPDIDLNLES